MRVVFDQKLMAGDYPAAAVDFIVGTIKRMALISPGDEFLMLVPDKGLIREVLPSNVRLIEPTVLANRFFGSRFAQRMRLPRIVKDLKPDLFVGIDNPLTGRYPEPHAILLLDPMNQGGGPGGLAARTEKAWLSAETQLSFIHFAKAAVDALPFRPQHTFMLPRPIPETPEPSSWTQKENVKVQYAGGYDYFLFAGDLDERYQLVDLLRAFSSFKKWQGSAMRLVLAGRETDATRAFENQLERYKYRGDVVLIRDPGEEIVNQLMTAAYAFVYPPSEDPFPINVLRAISASLPVICTATAVTREWVGDSVLYAPDPVAEGFSAAMQLLFKDETRRDKLIAGAELLHDEGGHEPATVMLNLLRRLSEGK